VVICLERGADCLRMVQLLINVLPKPRRLSPYLNPDWFLPRDAMHPRY